MRRRATLKLDSLKSALPLRAWITAIPAKTRRMAGFAALFVISALITLLVLVSGGNAVEAEPEQENAALSSVEQVIEDFSRPAAQARQSADTGPGGEDALRVQDFILPEKPGGDSSEPYLLRPPLERWGEQQVKRYWIPVEDIAADLVRRENDRRIEELFEDIP